VDFTLNQLVYVLAYKINELNNNDDVHGILLQHPVPEQIDERACFDAIELKKDVDGVTCLGFGRMSMGESAYGCATPKGIMRLLEAYDIPLAGKHAVVVGRSPILGKPMAMMLLAANATVTICHSRTQNLQEHIKQADIPLKDRVAAYTPVPGGVGPMTINTLIYQSVDSGEKSLG